MTIDNLSNEDLVQATIKCLEEISCRLELQEYLTEMTYNRQSDMYDTIYDTDTFKTTINDLKKYVSSQMYKINENKQKRL